MPNQDQIKELIFRPPNNGLRIPDEPDERDFRIGDYIQPSTGDLPVYVDLMNTYGYDQGRTNHCTAYATTLVCEIAAIKELKKKSIFFDPNIQWGNQLQNPGTADEKYGDYLQSAVKALKHFGLDGVGAGVEVDKYYYVPKEQWRQYLADGFAIMTGSFVGRPMIDSKYNWRPVRSGGGHAYVIVGYDDKSERYICQNSWGNKWGENNNGRFYVKYKDAAQLFRGWCLDLVIS